MSLSGDTVSEHTLQRARSTHVVNGPYFLAPVCLDTLGLQSTRSNAKAVQVEICPPTLLYAKSWRQILGREVVHLQWPRFGHATHAEVLHARFQQLLGVGVFAQFG